MIFYTFVSSKTNFFTHQYEITKDNFPHNFDVNFNFEHIWSKSTT